MTAASVTLEDKTLPKNTKELAEISAKQQALQKKMPEVNFKISFKQHILLQSMSQIGFLFPCRLLTVIFVIE